MQAFSKETRERARKQTSNSASSMEESMEAITNIDNKWLTIMWESSDQRLVATVQLGIC